MQLRKPFVVILEALNECGSPRARANLLKALAMHNATFAPHLRSVLTSRTERDIYFALESRSPYDAAGISNIALNRHPRLSATITITTRRLARHWRC